MIRTLKTTVLTAVTIAAAGCARSDFAVGPQHMANTATPEESRIAQAEEETAPPLILPDTFLAAGQLHEAGGMIGAAIDQYRKAIAVNHGFVAAYHRLALALSTLYLTMDGNQVTKCGTRMADPTDLIVLDLRGLQKIY